MNFLHLEKPYTWNFNWSNWRLTSCSRT